MVATLSAIFSTVLRLNQASVADLITLSATHAVILCRSLQITDVTMNLDFNLIVGVLAIAYGVYSFYIRKTTPQNIEKLQTMIERNGEKMAHTIHLIGYTILPIFTGLLLLHASYRNS